MTIVAKLDFIKLPSDLKLVFCKNVSSKLANPLVFPQVDIPISTINALIAEFETAIINAKDGSHTAALLLQDKEKELDDMFHLLVNYVNKVAKGNETIIVESGFNPSKVPTPHHKAEIAVKSGLNSGTVIVDIKAVQGAVAYNFVFKKETDEEYSDPVTRTYAQHEFTGLIPATYYYFSFNAVTKEGVSDYCDPVLKLVE
ncbi:MAG: hypothetical protein NTY69_05855 [Methylococcales bacterium]|nr:hypothetical protein [Methylococcales bacterium]